MKIQNDFKLNVVPLIDVMLVLLTIVLCTASFIEYGKIDMTLPKSTNSSNQFPKKRVEISLYANGVIKFEDDILELNELDDKLSALSNDINIIFKGDENANFKNFIEIIELLKKHNLSNFIIMTEVKNV